MILLLGASASGKTELAKYLFTHYHMVKAITHTTRPMRKGEKPDVDYHFVTKEEFLALKEKDAFVETTEYNGNFYGCSKAECGDDKCIILDPFGVLAFQRLGSPRIVTFFLRTSKQTRELRMRGRGDDEASIQKRLTGDDITFDEKTLPQTDYVLDCDDISVETLAKKVYSLYQSRLSL